MHLLIDGATGGLAFLNKKVELSAEEKIGTDSWLDLKPKDESEAPEASHTRLHTVCDRRCRWGAC